MLQLLTTVYGQTHIARFCHGTLKSLSWRKNRQALYKHCSTWNIFTDDVHFTDLHKLIDAYLPELKINLISTSNLRDYTDPVQSALVWQIGQCLAKQDRMLMVPPDTLFSDGSINNLLGIGQEPGTCVAVAHARVLPSFLSTDLSLSLNSPEMVDRAWQHLHRSWLEAQIGCVNQNSFVGGVAWSETAASLINVQHRLPTIYLADFTAEDLNYFKTVISSGHFDHKWPGDLLLPRGRIRYVGSSDQAFLVEITEADKNVPPIVSGADPFDFWQKNAHNETFKQIAVTFRGEGG